MRFKCHATYAHECEVAELKSYPNSRLFLEELLLFVLSSYISRSESLQSMQMLCIISSFFPSLSQVTTGAFEGHSVPPVFKSGNSVIAVVKSSAEVSVTVGIKDEQ